MKKSKKKNVFNLVGPLKEEKFQKFSLKFRAIFENYEKEQKKKRFQFGWGAEGGNFGAAEGGKISKIFFEI